jgi:hypothetical protein
MKGAWNGGVGVARGLQHGQGGLTESFGGAADVGGVLIGGDKEAVKVDHQFGGPSIETLRAAI